MAEKEDNEEAVSREEIKKTILLFKDIDLGILDAYNDLSPEFRAKLSFDVFYKFYRNLFNDAESQEDESSEEEIKALETAFTSSLSNNPQADFDESLCEKCHKNLRSFGQYCLKCENELRGEAQKIEERIVAELKIDQKFKGLSSMDKAIAYVRDKYANVKNTPFLFLPKIAKNTRSTLQINHDSG